MHNFHSNAAAKQQMTEFSPVRRKSIDSFRSFGSPLSQLSPNANYGSNTRGPRSPKNAAMSMAAQDAVTKAKAATARRQSFESAGSMPIFDSNDLNDYFYVDDEIMIRKTPQSASASSQRILHNSSPEQRAYRNYYSLSHSASRSPSPGQDSSRSVSPVQKRSRSVEKSLSPSKDSSIEEAMKALVNAEVAAVDAAIEAERTKVMEGTARLRDIVRATREEVMMRM